MQPALSRNSSDSNPLPQEAPGSVAALGHSLENSIPLSIFPIQPDKLCVCLCGLPGRGKTQIARRLARYLSFFHALPAQNFNVGEYRRRTCGVIKDADWFDDNNEEAFKWRMICNEQALSDCCDFLENVKCGIAILDGTNGSHVKRATIQGRMRSQGVNVLFIEVQNNSPEFLTEQYRAAAHTMPDYMEMSDSEAELDYLKRVALYKDKFESLSVEHPVESKWSFMICDHTTRSYEMHNVRGNVPLQVVNFVMNMRTGSHEFYLSRHGQSEYNSVGKIGGDSGLTAHGLCYARKLAEFVDMKITKSADGKVVPARLWTSTMRRTIETAQFIKHDTIIARSDRSSDGEEEMWMQMRPRRWFHLDEIFAGSCDGMTYEDMMELAPEEFKLRETDKLAYRYPRGESYLDVIARLQPVIIEMERLREPLLIVGHQGILRIIYAFYMGLSRNEAPHVSIPLNTVLELKPQAFYCNVEKHVLYSPEEGLASDGQDEL